MNLEFGKFGGALATCYTALIKPETGLNRHKHRCANACAIGKLRTKFGKLNINNIICLQ